ncbi:MAG: glycosyltransferase family 4 protein [Candidatus Paceibacterota bacterium]
MEKTKILFLITKSNFGGAQRYVFELATNLPKERYDVTVAFGGSGILKKKLESAGIRTCEIKSFQRDISLLKELRSLLELWRLFRSERPDIIHLNSTKAVGLGALVGRLTGVPFIVSTIHGWPFLEPRHRLWRAGAWFVSWISALLAHRIILVSEHDAAKRMPFVHHSVSVIHTSVPAFTTIDREAARAALFDEQTIEQHRSHVWLVSVAELTPNKNLITALQAIRAYNETAHQPIFYTLIGDGELQAELMAYVREHALESSVAFAGYVEDARRHLSAFDLFLLPSHKEGLPYAILEAGAAGLPVIASNVGGIPEVVRDGYSGILIDPNQPDEIVHALKTLISSPELRSTYERNLIQDIHQQFSLERMLANTIAVYQLDHS